MPLIYDAADVVADNSLKVITISWGHGLSVFANIVQHFMLFIKNSVVRCQLEPDGFFFSWLN